jgi:hypothetical protein
MMPPGKIKPYGSTSATGLTIATSGSQFLRFPDSIQQARHILIKTLQDLFFDELADIDDARASHRKSLGQETEVSQTLSWTLDCRLSSDFLRFRRFVGGAPSKVREAK